MDPILIVLLKHIEKNSKVKSGDHVLPEMKVRG